MNICFVDTAWPINSRTQRFADCCDGLLDTSVIAWNRSGTSNVTTDNCFVLDSNVGYGKPFAKALSIFKFAVFSYKIIKKSKPDILFLSHWDSLLVGVILSMFVGYKPKIIYDCLDVPTTSSRFLFFILNKIEKKCVKYADLTVFASRFFSELYDIPDSKALVFENYPSLKLSNNEHSDSCDNKYVSHYNKLKSRGFTVVSWIGVVRYPDIMKNLISSVLSTPNLHLFIFGDGPSLNEIKEYCVSNEALDKISFFGRYDYGEIHNIYSVTDYVWAAYPSSDFNVQYAISNKYFECNLYKKVPIFSKYTMIAKQEIEKGSNVIVVDENSVEDISHALFSLNNTKFITRYDELLFWEDRVQVFLNKIKN